MLEHAVNGRPCHQPGNTTADETDSPAAFQALHSQVAPISYSVTESTVRDTLSKLDWSRYLSGWSLTGFPPNRHTISGFGMPLTDAEKVTGKPSRTCWSASWTTKDGFEKITSTLMADDDEPTRTLYLPASPTADLAMKRVASPSAFNEVLKKKNAVKKTHSYTFFTTKTLNKIYY